MIIGNVNAHREAVIKLAVRGKSRQSQGITAVIDTGYTGFLTLPSMVIKKLGLVWYVQQEGILGDGSVCIFNVYEALVLWDSLSKPVEINESETVPLVGMGLLEGYELNVQAIAGGLVTVTALY